MFTADGLFTHLILHPVVQLCPSIFWTRSVDGQGTRYDTGGGASARFGTFSESEHTTVERLWAYLYNRLANKRASRIVIYKLGASRSG